MKKLSLEAFKEKFESESKQEVIEELTGGILGHCHCGTEHHNHGGMTPEEIDAALKRLFGDK